MKAIFLVLITMILFSQGYSQDTVLFVSGDKLPVMNYFRDTTDQNVFILKTMKGKYKSINKEEIFSFIKKTGGEEIIFEPFEAEDANFTVENMRIYIRGEQAARKNVKTWLPATTSFLIGTAAPLLLTRVGSYSMFYSPIPVALSNFVIGLTVPTKESILKKYPEEAQNQYFMEGYQLTGRSKRLNNSIKTGLIGLGIGIISAIVIR